MAIKRKPKPKPGERKVLRRPIASDLPPVKTARLADLFGVTAPMIGQWAALGVVVKTGHGTFDLERSIKGWAKFMRARGAKATTATSSVAGERAGLLSVQRRRAELAFAKERGDLVSRTEIMREVAGDAKHVQLQLSMLYGFLLNSGVDQRLARMVADKVLEGTAIIADNGSLHEHGGYDSEGMVHVPLDQETYERLKHAKHPAPVPAAREVAAGASPA